MVRRDATLLVCGLLIVAILLYAGDTSYFLYQQRHGNSLSTQIVRQYGPVNDGDGNYHYQYVATVVVPCVQALLPHQGMPPCWWVSSHSRFWT